METRILKSQLENLVEIINMSSPFYEIVFNQQSVSKKNMSISGGNGRLWVQPVKDGYHVSLSGKSLVKEMSPFMRDLFKKKHDGFKQPNSKKGRLDQPYWKTDDFEFVVRAVFFYSRTVKQRKIEMSDQGV